MRIKFWNPALNKYSESKNRLRIFTIAFGDGYRPLAGSKKYYRYFLTVALRLSLFSYRRIHLSNDWTICLFFVEIHFRY